MGGDLLLRGALGGGDGDFGYAPTASLGDLGGVEGEGVESGTLKVAILAGIGFGW